VDFQVCFAVRRTDDVCNRTVLIAFFDLYHGSQVDIIKEDKFIMPVTEGLYCLVLIYGSPNAEDNEAGEREGLTAPCSILMNEFPGLGYIHLNQPVDRVLYRPGLEGFQNMLSVLWKWDYLSTQGSIP
jgi:hypothetical protein